jgi:hypothetical protein
LAGLHFWGDSVVWAVLYPTFSLSSRRRVVQRILFGVGVIAAVTGMVLMLEGWHAFYMATTLIPFGTRVWAWCAIAGTPLVVADFKGHKGLIPPAAALAVAISLP